MVEHPEDGGGCDGDEVDGGQEDGEDEDEAVEGTAAPGPRLHRPALGVWAGSRLHCLDCHSEALINNSHSQLVHHRLIVNHDQSIRVSHSCMNGQYPWIVKFLLNCFVVGKLALSNVSI